MLQNEAQQSKRFLNMCIHDMRNPTTAIKFGIEQVLLQLADI